MLFSKFIFLETLKYTLSIYYKMLLSSAQFADKWSIFVNALKDILLTGISMNVGFETANSLQAH